MKVKVIPIEEIQTKKGKYLYRSIFRDNGRQRVVNVLTNRKKELNKEIEVEISFGSFWFEN